MAELDRRDVMKGIVAGAALCVTGCVVDEPGDPGDTAVGTLDTAVGDWATGGTAMLAADYAITFDDTCAQECELTLGPCYAETLERRDISEGVDCLPTRVAFRVVDTDCNPVAGAVVDIWHCDPNGLYSGSDAQQMCTDGDSAARASRWFRGTQTTDADGRVDFDSCMPGWYSGRAVHIHFQVRVGGQSTLTSQFGFDAALIADVYANHPIYAARGQPDTPNGSDNIFSGNNDGSLLFDWRQADDGALVVYKTLVVRSSLSDPQC